MGILPMLGKGLGQDAHATALPEQSPIPIEYQTPPPAGKRPSTSIGLTVYFSFVTLVVLLFGWFVLPRVEMAYGDFKLELPLVTVVMIRAARLLTRSPAIVLLLAIPVFVPMLIARITYVEGAPERTRRRMYLARLLITFIMALMVLLVAAALLLPLAGILESLSSPGSGNRK